MNINDEVTISGRVIAITESNNPIIELKSGIRFLVKTSDIKSIHPYKAPSRTDQRREK